MGPIVRSAALLTILSLAGLSAGLSNVALALGIAVTASPPPSLRLSGAPAERRMALPITVDRLEAPPPPARAVPRERLRGFKVLVIGSFRRIGNAKRLAERWSSLSASIVPAEVGGVRFYRVVAAPAGRDGVAAQKRLLFGAGVDRSWLAPICTSGLVSMRCVSLPAAAIGAWSGKPIAPPGD